MFYAFEFAKGGGHVCIEEEEDGKLSCSSPRKHAKTDGERERERKCKKGSQKQTRIGRAGLVAYELSLVM